MNEEQTKFRQLKSILAILYFQEGMAMNLYALRNELEKRHGQVLTIARVQSLAVFLKDIGALDYDGQMAALTPDGQDMAQGRRDMV